MPDRLDTLDLIDLIQVVLAVELDLHQRLRLEDRLDVWLDEFAAAVEQYVNDSPDEAA